MISVKSLFRILDRYGGYPNPRLQQICEFSGFDSGELLKNMVEEFGYEKTKEIISAGLKKDFSDKKLRIEIDTRFGEGFLEIIYISSKLVKTKDGPEFHLEYSYGDSNIPIMDNETEEEQFKTIEDVIYDNPYEGIEEDTEQWVITPHFYNNYGFVPIYKLTN
jgi:hypothetical protein